MKLKYLTTLFYLILTTIIIRPQESEKIEVLTKVINRINQNDYLNALTLVDSILNKEELLLKQTPNKNTFRLLSQTYGFKGQIEWMLDKDYHDTLFFKSIEYAKKNKDSTTIAKSYLNLGRIYEIKSNYPSSVNYYIKSLPYVKNNCELLSRTLDNISYSLTLLKKYDKAHNYILQAYTISENCDNDFQKVFIYNSLAAFYIESKKNQDSILFYLNKALNLANEINHNEGLSITHSNYSDFYIKNKRFKEAIIHCKFGLNEAIDLGDKESEAHSLLQLGIISLKINKIDEAIRYSSEALSIFETIEAHSLKADALLNLSESYKKNGDYKKSYEHYKQYVTINDSLQNIKKVKEFSNSLIKYETNKIKSEKKIIEKENIIHQKNIEKNRLYTITLIIVFILILFTIIGISLIINSRKKAQLIKLELAETKNRLQMEKKLRESEIKSIRSQMSPHFIFNSINSIQALILKKNYENAYKYLNIFSNLIRNTLTFSETDFISINAEVQFLMSYLDLEFLRFDDHFSYQINNEITDQETLLPSIIIQPFIENSVKHGLFHKTGDKNIVINFIKIDQNFIKCEIIDNGIGRFEAEKIKNRQELIHSSFSTQAIDKRINILKAFYGSKVNYDIIDLIKPDGSSNGTKVSLTLPIKK